MELNETTVEGALRETDEEAGAQLDLGPLYTIIDVPYAQQVHFYYLGYLRNDELNPGPETSETMFVSPDEIPWDELAFRTVSTTLEHYCEDLKKGYSNLITMPWPRVIFRRRDDGIQHRFLRERHAFSRYSACLRRWIAGCRRRPVPSPPAGCLSSGYISVV